MAETWTYYVYWDVDLNIKLPDNGSARVRIKRADNTSKNGELYKIVDGESKISSNVNLKTWNNGTLVFGSYGETGNIEQNTSNHKISNISFTPNASILDVVGTEVTTYITRGDNSSQTLWIYGSPKDTLAFTISVKVEEKYTASTLSGGNTTFGSNSTVTISNTGAYAADLTHKVKWSVSGNSLSHNSGDQSKSGTGNLSYPIPSSWMDTTPNSRTITCNLELKTYYGQTQIGSTYTNTCTLTVPDSVKPTIGSITCTIKNENQGIPGTYIQNTTGVYIQLNNITPSTGTSLNSGYTYPISANVQEEYSFDSANYKYSINRLANSGEITFSVSVKDSRGIQSEPATATISVMPYTLPSITTASAYRSRADGIADELGTYATIRIVAEYSATGGNTMVINSTYYQENGSSTQYTAVNNMTSGETYTVGDDDPPHALDPSYAYFVRFTITDSLGNVVTRDVRVVSSAFAIHVKNGGSGVAFGKTSEIANSVEINQDWALYYKGLLMLPIIYYVPTQAQPEPSTSFEGLIWLKPAT